MRPARQLREFAAAARAMLAREPDLAQFEIYCVSGDHRVARLAYTSDIPSSGVEELKSHVAEGFALRIVMRRDARESGMATEAGDFSIESLRAALERARRAALVDPHFPGLPRKLREPGRNGRGAVSGGLMSADDSALVATAWSIIRGALEEFASSNAATRAGLVLGGDVSVMRDQMALAGSNFDGIRIEPGARFTSTVTALVESIGAKGTASALGATQREMRAAGEREGRDAIARALALGSGERPPGGVYRIVFGPQPVAELLNYVVVPSMTTGAFHAANTAYYVRFGAQVMDSRLSLYDDPAARNGAVRRQLTCEGVPARRTVLVRDGKLVGLLSNFYDSHRLEIDEHRAEKLGSIASGAIHFPPNSGYRLGESGVRRFDAYPGSVGTNVVMRGRRAVGEPDLVKTAGEGIYVGRVWYTYPINGQRAGDFTCTITGDSYVIRNGQLASPLAPNAMRINANIEQVFARPLGVGNRTCATLVWGAPEAYYVPALAAEGIELAAIEAS
jgi:PmbA protein